jgi:hypothetical protein
MIESPVIERLLAKTRRKDILEVLKERFHTVPRDITTRLDSAVKEKELLQLLRLAVTCPSLDEFKEGLS